MDNKCLILYTIIKQYFIVKFNSEVNTISKILNFLIKNCLFIFYIYSINFHKLAYLWHNNTTMDCNNNENCLEWNISSMMNHNTWGVSLHLLYAFFDKDVSVTCIFVKIWKH